MRNIKELSEEINRYFKYLQKFNRIEVYKVEQLQNFSHLFIKTYHIREKTIQQLTLKILSKLNSNKSEIVLMQLLKEPPLITIEEFLAFKL